MRQFALQPDDLSPRLKLQKISKIFITHMHADHIMGIVPLLRNRLHPPSKMDAPMHASSAYIVPTVEIYGPAGLRIFVRQIMKMTLTRTTDRYVVHELLTPSDSITPCVPRAADADPADFNVLQNDIMHSSEVAGSDIRATTITGEPQADGVNRGYWYSFATDDGKYCPITVSAGSILHRDPCIGYIFRETRYPARKLVILGDTHDPNYVLQLCINPSPSLLVHEATDSCISREADSTGKLSRRSEEEVKGKALERGHSTAEMAGLFARAAGAHKLVLNHIGARFPAPRHARDFKYQDIMRDIEDRASQAWGANKSAIAAYDFLRVHIPVPYAATRAERLDQINYAYAYSSASAANQEGHGQGSGTSSTYVHTTGYAYAHYQANTDAQENLGKERSRHEHGHRHRSHRERERGSDGDSPGRGHPYHKERRSSNKTRDSRE